MKQILGKLGLVLFLLLAPAQTVVAADPLPSEPYTLTVPLIGKDGQRITTISALNEEGQRGANLAEYIKTIYLTLMGVAGLLAMANIVYGGILYTLSAGNITTQDDAKDRITQAVVGLALLFGSFLILRTISPDFSAFKNPKLPKLTEPAGSLSPQLKGLQDTIKKLEGERAAAADQMIREQQEAARLQTELDEAIKNDADPVIIARARLALAQKNLAAAESLHFQAQNLLNIQKTHIISVIIGQGGPGSAADTYYKNSLAIIEAENGRFKPKDGNDTAGVEAARKKINEKLAAQFSSATIRIDPYGGRISTDEARAAAFRPIYTGLQDLAINYLNLTLNYAGTAQREQEVLAAEEAVRQAGD